MKISSMTFGILMMGLVGLIQEQGWQAGEITVNVTKNPMSIKVSAGTKTLLDITSIAFGGSNFSSISSVAPTTDALDITLSSNAKITIKPVLNGIYFCCYHYNIRKISFISLNKRGNLCDYPGSKYQQHC